MTTEATKEEILRMQREFHRQSAIEHSALLSFLGLVALFIILNYFFTPRWQENDDIGMSMLAHGYGLVEYGSSNLVFSNILWGHFVSLIPDIGGILGYSLASMAALFFAGWSIFYFLLRLGVGKTVSSLVILLLLTRPILFPQFTITAGLLTLAGVLGLQVYSREGGAHILIVSCILAMVGYLVRWEEFCLVLAVSAPFLPWRALKDSVSLRATCLFFVTSLLLAGALNKNAYSGDDWQSFKEFNLARVTLHDFGAGERLIAREDILDKYGYSKNDIALISNWFFVDRRLIKTESLDQMLSMLGSESLFSGAVWRVYNATRSLFHPVLLPLLLAGGLLFVCAPTWRSFGVGILFFAALSGIALLDHGVVSRVNIPLLSMIVVAALLANVEKERNSQRFIDRKIHFILLAALIGNTWIILQETNESERLAEVSLTDVKALPDETIYVWGGGPSGFPFEAVFSVWARDESVRKLRLYGLNWLTLIPSSVAFKDDGREEGMLKKMQEPAGIVIWADSKYLNRLGAYCSEHMNGILLSTRLDGFQSGNISRTKCRSKKDMPSIA